MTACNPTTGCVQSQLLLRLEKSSHIVCRSVANLLHIIGVDIIVDIIGKFGKSCCIFSVLVVYSDLLTCTKLQKIGKCWIVECSIYIKNLENWWFQRLQRGSSRGIATSVFSSLLVQRTPGIPNSCIQSVRGD